MRTLRVGVAPVLLHQELKISGVRDSDVAQELPGVDVDDQQDLRPPPGRLDGEVVERPERVLCGGPNSVE